MIVDIYITCTSIELYIKHSRSSLSTNKLNLVRLVFSYRDHGSGFAMGFYFPVTAVIKTQYV